MRHPRQHQQDAVAAPDAAGYEVSLTRYAGERTVVATVDAATRTATLDGLETWKPYYLTVRAFDQAVWLGGAPTGSLIDGPGNPLLWPVS